MTQAAVLDRDLNIFDPEAAKINGFQSQRLFGCLCHPSRLTLTADMFNFLSCGSVTRSRTQ